MAISVGMISRRAGVACALVFALLVACGATGRTAGAGAEALSPWFHLSSQSRPGNLAPASYAHDEVQEITVYATSGDFYLEDPETGENDVLPPLPYDASPQEVQGVLEALYGAGEVEVSSGEGNRRGTEPYVVTFSGARTYRHVGEIVARSFPEAFDGYGPLEGGKGANGAVSGEQAISSVQTVEGGFRGSVIAVSVVNVGDASANAETAPIKLSDVLPPHVKAVFVEGDSRNQGGDNEIGAFTCEAKTVSCTFSRGCPKIEPGCFHTEPTLPPFFQLEMAITVEVEPGAVSGELNEVIASGGGAPTATYRHPITVSGSPQPYGVETFEMVPEEVGGGIDKQAGSHPYQYTTTLNLNDRTTYNPEKNWQEPVPVALPKDVVAKLPPGLIGDPTAYPRCTLSAFLVEDCAASSAVGVAAVTFASPSSPGPYGLDTGAVPIYDLETSVGEPARFGFMVAKVPTFLNASVRTGEDYGVTVTAADIPQNIGFLSNTVTFWGVPGEASHDLSRGLGCIEAQDVEPGKAVHACEPASETSPAPFLTLPSSCSGSALQGSVETDSWAERGRMVSPEPDPTYALPTLSGCGLLPFGAEISVAPDVEAGSTPSGLNVDVHVPQEDALNARSLAPADVQNITVALPAGLSLNPSAADGLQACAQLHGRTAAQEELEAKHEISGIDLETPQPANCPDASKIANVTIKTPLLPAGENLHGAVYLAAPQNFQGGLPQNPFGSLVAMYLVADDPTSGTLIKLPGSVSLSATGQITSTFANNPQLPFEDAEIEFFGGERAPLATPARCGLYETRALFEPWSNTSINHEALSATSRFRVSSGPGGSPCPGATLPFGATLQSDTTNVNAGSFTPLSTTLSRGEGQQNITSVELHYPPGVSGLLSGVKLCDEQDANAGTCGPESEIGETIVSVGLGGDPFTVTGGKVYLTEKYDGAPFGLSIVNPAKAGPFILQEGRPVVVRAKIEVDPHTAALTVTTDESGAHAIPSILEGFPLQIKHVNVTINRPNFTFNPTSCEKMQITGQVRGGEGGVSPVSEPFQVANCANLKFTPKFQVSTSAKTSKADGASLTARVSEPNEPQGSQANIARVKVELPIQLPSRLTTLQKACTQSQFQANPAGCPTPSIIGHAIVHTQLLPVPLEGPVYFVSNGGEAFPNLVMVLQGDGVTIDLVGDTFISKAGITSTTFKAVPDAPFHSFEITLGQGPYSALAATGNLCEANLEMPNEFVAQSGGAPLVQKTPITVEGCKPAIYITGHTVKNGVATLKVKVPTAGTLTATGKGLAKATKKATAAGTVTVKLHLTKAETKLLKAHKGRKLKAKIELTFAPKKGSKLKAGVAVSVG